MKREQRVLERDEYAGDQRDIAIMIFAPPFNVAS
jgi:hypothetical protein